ncbi:hypothetical protein CPC08DRAFT_709981 [Agrocybe pediades]|nr:hypothetical protein CPC08DRAFT_709981 [Agrocybe pediades]
MFRHSVVLLILSTICAFWGILCVSGAPIPEIENGEFQIGARNSMLLLERTSRPSSLMYPVHPETVNQKRPTRVSTTHTHEPLSELVPRCPPLHGSPFGVALLRKIHCIAKAPNPAQVLKKSI